MVGKSLVREDVRDCGQKLGFYYNLGKSYHYY